MMGDKTLILLRGLPGSGKSTLARMIAPVSHYETDDYFVNLFGDYKFEPSKLKEVHKFTQGKVEDNLRLGLHSIVVVSNTFTQEWEMKPYMDMAEKYGFRVVTMVMENRHGGESTHNVPDEVIDRMTERFEIKLKN